MHMVDIHTIYKKELHGDSKEYPSTLELLRIKIKELEERIKKVEKEKK